MTTMTMIVLASVAACSTMVHLSAATSKGEAAMTTNDAHSTECSYSFTQKRPIVGKCELMVRGKAVCLATYKGVSQMDPTIPACLDITTVEQSGKVDCPMEINEPVAVRGVCRNLGGRIGVCMSYDGSLMEPMASDCRY